MKIKRWKKPRIKELMYGAPQELVLQYCKDHSASSGGMGAKCCMQYDCAGWQLGGCTGNCSSISYAFSAS